MRATAESDPASCTRHRRALAGEREGRFDDEDEDEDDLDADAPVDDPLRSRTQQ